MLICWSEVKFREKITPHRLKLSPLYLVRLTMGQWTHQKRPTLISLVQWKGNEKSERSPRLRIYSESLSRVRTNLPRFMFRDKSSWPIDLGLVYEYSLEKWALRRVSLTISLGSITSLQNSILKDVGMRSRLQNTNRELSYRVLRGLTFFLQCNITEGRMFLLKASWHIGSFAYNLYSANSKCNL